MKKLFSLVLALALALTAVAALAESTEVPTTGNYTIYNGTGEKVTELYLIDNLYADDEQNAENWALDPDDPSIDGLGANEVVEIAYTPTNVPTTTDEAHGRIKLVFKTESGYEGSFDTLSIENAPITLYAADVRAGVTNIFQAKQVGAYVIYNLTGEKVTDLTITLNEGEEEVENLAGEEGLAANASIQVYKVIDAALEGRGALTIAFKTESGYEGKFETLSIEVAPISLLTADASATATNNNQVSFTVPAE